VLVRPNRQLSVGKGTAAYKKYQARLTGGPVRLFPLDENEDSFAQLECLRQMVRKARAGDLSLNGQAIEQEQCRRLIIQTGLLAKLKLFDQLFCNWKAVGTQTEPATPTSSKPVLVKSATKGGQTQSASSESSMPTSATVQTVPPPSGNTGWAEQTLLTVVEKLRHKGQPVCPVGVEVGATFVRLMVTLQDDADFAKVKKQADNLKLHLKLAQRPLIAAQAGYISIDIQRPDRQVLRLSQVMANCPDSLAERPVFPAGQDVAGKAHWLDLSEPGTCHLLVAGTTGSGKSEFLKAMLAGLAHRLGPDQLQFALIDPKQVTFNLSGDSPYLRGEVAYDVADALPVVADCLQEMTRRYTLLRQRGKEHIGQLAGSDAVARWVVVFDEFADLMADKGAKKELETLLKRLGAMGRAAGIHLVLGTQRPEASVVTPLLRDNLPARVGLHMAGERGSKLILEEPDAAYLLGKGDLFLRQSGGLLRLQSAYVTKDEFEAALRCH
jgi:S-DNA-T family DNA segregation ATPase FtsK/SpoIIIE